MSDTHTNSSPPDLTIVRANLEYDIAARVDDSTPSPSTGEGLIPDDYALLGNGHVECFGEKNAIVKVAHTGDTITIQVDIHGDSLPVEPSQEDIATEERPTALSDLSEALQEYERTIINTITTELGKNYSGDNSTAVIGRDEATLAYQPDECMYSTPTDMVSFCCRLNPDLFWEVN